MNLWDKAAYRKDGRILDCTDGAAHQALMDHICPQYPRAKVISLTLNTDGVQVHSDSNKSFWPFLLVINELPKEERFAHVFI